MKIPVLNILFRVISFSFWLTIFGFGIVALVRAGETAAARGVWRLPQVPEFFVMSVGAVLVFVSLIKMVWAVLPNSLRRSMIR